MANTVLNLKINAQFDELTQLNAEAQRSRDRLDAMAAASKILGKSVDNTDAAIEAHLRSLKTLQQNLDRNSKEYKQAQQEIKKYSQELKDAGDDINKQGSLLDKIGNGLRGFGVAMAAAFSVDAIVSFTQELAQSAIQIENYAIATGTTVEEMSRISVAAQKTGVDVNDLGDILKDIVEKIDILQRGEGGEQENNLVRGLEQVGVALKNTDGSYRDAYDILVDYGRATQDLTKDQKLAANAMLVLENGNMQYLSAVQKLGAEQGRQAPLTQRQVDALKELHEAQVEFNLALQTLAANVLPELLRGIKSVVDGFNGLPSWAKDAIAVGGTSAINPAIGLNIIGNRIRQAIQGTNNDDLKFIPPDIKSIPKKITEQAKNSIMASQAELTKLQDRLVRAVTDTDRAQLQTRIEEVKKTIAEMDGSAAQEREKLAEQEAKKAQQLAEKQAQERQQIEQKIHDLRAGYEQDIADQRINALKRIQELERDFIKQRGDAESKLADAILRRDRAREDADLRLRLRSGELTQEQFDLITQSNTYTRNHQDAVLNAERERLEIQEQYLQNVGAIAQAELESKQQVIDLDKRYLTSQQNILRTPSTGLNKLPSQGQLPPPPATGLSYTGATPRGQKLTFNQIAQLAHSVGFNNQDSIIMAGIVMAESSGHTKAFNNVGYDLSYGLAQINMLGAMGPERRTRFGIKSNEDLYDPETNLRAAYRLYQDRGGENSRGRFDDWTTFTQGIFKQYLPNDASRIPLQPVTVQSIAPQAMQPLFALADKFRFSTSVSVPTTSLTDSQTQLGSSPFGKLQYQNFAGRFGMGAQVFGGQPNFAGLLPYPGQIQSIGMQAAGMNLQAAQYGIQPQYPSDLTNPRSGALAMAQQQFQITLQQLALERQVGQEVANRVIKIQEESRIEAAALQQRNQDLQLQIRSGNLDQQQIQSLQNEIVLNQDKLTQLQQLPTLYQQELVAQQQQLQMINMERQLQSDIANIISQNITQGIMNLIQGSQSLGEVLNNIVLNVLNQILQKLIAMVIEATVLQAIMAAIGGGGGGIFGIFGKLFGGGGGGAAAAAPAAAARASAAAAAPRFANGGIMTADGTLPLSRYARGGIARSPQLAMFGEGSMPEAFVPLPDGRTIPVTIRAFANGGVYYPQRYNVFDDPFLNTVLTGMPDTALSRRYQEDDVLRQRMDSVFDEYVGTLYTILDDVGTGDVSSNHIQQLFARSVEDLVADNREFFDDTQFSDYLINRGIGEFFTNNENAYNLMQRSGAYDSENVGAFISNMQRQAFGIIRNQEQFEVGRRLGISGMLGDYYKQLEPTQNYFNDRVRDEQNPFFRMIRESAGIPLRGYQKPQRYARGGIARSPQLAMFGEGSMPEAFVPLPDGRTIPVSLMGGGGSNTTNNVSVSINANGLNQTSDSVNGAQLGRRIARAVQDEISRQQRPGGSLR